MKRLTIRLDDDVYERLCRRARADGLAPEAVAGEAVRNGLKGDEASSDTLAELRAAFARMRARRQRLPEVSVTELMWEARDELIARGNP